MKPDLWCGCSSSRKESKQNLQVCFLHGPPEEVEGAEAETAMWKS